MAKSLARAAEALTAVANVGDAADILKSAISKRQFLDYVLVPLGMAVFLGYHVWLLCTILRRPRRTVIGLNAESRRRWVFCLMSDPLKNGVLAVQTIRNNIMASTLLATAAITMCSLISVYVSNQSSASAGEPKDERRDKFFAILVCFLAAFLCNVQSIRYYAHVSFLATAPDFGDKAAAMEYVAKNLNRGSYFWSMGMRAFYLSGPLFLWVFGPVAMFACCVVMTFALYFLDTVRDVHRTDFIVKEGDGEDEEEEKDGGFV